MQQQKNRAPSSVRGNSPFGRTSQDYMLEQVAKIEVAATKDCEKQKLRRIALENQGAAGVDPRAVRSLKADLRKPSFASSLEITERVKKHAQ